jgi:hypothetical protein
MHELSFRTIRIRRGPLGWLKRLRPFYETQVTMESELPTEEGLPPRPQCSRHKEIGMRNSKSRRQPVHWTRDQLPPATIL